MNETIISLSGGTFYLTKQSDVAYRVESGSVLVYLLPLKEDGRPGRRFLIYEAKEGELLPGFCCEAPSGLDDNARLCPWHFGLAALDKAEIRVLKEKAGEELQKDFLKRAGIRSGNMLSYEECILETYWLNIARELRNIYKTGEEQEASYQRGLHIIYNLFRSKRDKIAKVEPTGNHIYDAAAVLCGYMNIKIASLDSIQTSSGRKFGIKDIARVSHFICRDVILSEDWYKHDSGPLLVYLEKQKAPVVCIPKGMGGYVAINPVNGQQKKVDRKLAEKIKPQAYMFYRPLPNKKLGVRDLVQFVMQNIYKSDIFNLLFFALIGTLIGLLIPMISEKLYDSFIPMGDKNGLVQVCCVVLACTLGNISFTIVKDTASFRSISSMKYHLQSAVYDRLFNLPESFFRNYDSADLAQRAMGVSQVFELVADTIVGVGLTAFFSLLYLWRMFKYSSKLAWISILMLVIGMGSIFILGWRQIRFERDKMEVDGKVSSLMYQILGGISKIRIAGVEDRALYEYLKPYTKSRSINITKETYTVWANTLMGALNIIFSLVLYYIMIRKNLELSVGAFMGFNAAFGSFSAAMLEVVNSILTVNSVGPAFERMKPILETLSEMEDDMVLPGDLSGEIEVSHVTFAYDEEVGPVLHDLSVHIKPGEYVGVVGSSGCGKSTLLKLLLGFETPKSGKIFYDGKDIDAMDKRELRKKFGVVLQNGGLISGSISENITITAPGTSLKRVKEVIKEVGLEEDIASMPMGLHTMVTEGGGTVSGGQQQRILIARAIVGKPKVLFFDEATSALDNTTQALVCESLEKLGATRLVIAHRLSTVMNCDRILVMDRGQIVEEGNYEQLMEKKGLFYQLASRQIM